jgi:FtsH-binding integral membrane protein
MTTPNMHERFIHLIAKTIPILDLLILVWGPIINRYTLKTDIFSTVLFTLLCGFTFGFLLNTRVYEIFVATAAYAAILIVLIQTDR